MSDLLPVHLAHLRAGGYSDRTIRDRARILLHAERHLPYGLDEAHPDEIAIYLGTPGWSAWTRCTYHAHLHGYYLWAYEEGELTLDPMARLARPKSGACVPKPVTSAQLQVALASAEPWRTAVILAAYAGLRACEIAVLDRADVTDATLTVRAGKGGRDAILPTHAAVWATVAPLPAGPIVRNRWRQPVTAHYLTTCQRGHFDRLGLPGVHLHRFRHWYATELLRQGADLRVVQELMRHRSVTSTMGYTAITDGQRSKAIRTLPILHGPQQDAA